LGALFDALLLTIGRTDWLDIGVYPDAGERNECLTALRQKRPLTNELGKATSYLIGAGYLTASDTTYIVEYDRNGTGYSRSCNTPASRT
jgi:hypothetical protein